jgi:hypothetical protein
MNEKEILKIVIMQMLEHNNGHIEKYARWGQFAKTNQLVDASALLEEARKYSDSLSAVLKKALNHLSLLNQKVA